MLGPLEGIRVLTVEGFVSAPVATMWLADAGAEVVKVESPTGGDHSRNVAPFEERDGVRRSLSFIRSNRNKRSVALDLKAPTDMEVFRQLVGVADVFVENLRPTAIAALGLTYAELVKINPRLIYAGISGFGLPEFNEGELAGQPSLDVVAQAMSGLMFRPEGSAERPVYSGTPLADIFASANLQAGVYQALFNRERTGEGAYIDIALLDGAVALNELALIMYNSLGVFASPGQHGLAAPFGAYPTSDGWIVIAVLGEAIWRRFVVAMGREDIGDNAEYQSGVARHEHRTALDSVITGWTQTLTVAEAVERLRMYHVPCGPVLDIDDVSKLQNLDDRGMLMRIDDPVWGETTVAGNPLVSSLMSDTQARPAPELGADNDVVLREWLGVAV
jgi:CoA:oxalate CoA-transferase